MAGGGLIVKGLGLIPTHNLAVFCSPMQIGSVDWCPNIRGSGLIAIGQASGILRVVDVGTTLETFMWGEPS